MQEFWECPNCNSDAVVPDSRRLEGKSVLHCMNCDSWFEAISGATVLFVADGGDDVPDPFEYKYGADF